MEQRIGFATRPDGVRIAYAVVGQGPPLVKFGPWGHLELMWGEPRARSFFEALARDHMLVRFDKHGTGLSDRDRSDFTLSAEVADLAAVVDHLGLDEFGLFGCTGETPATIAYAADNPGRVRRLILFAPFAFGGGVGSKEVRDSAVSLLRTNYRLGTKVFADVIGGGDPDCERALAEIMPRAAAQETTARLFELVYETDVRQALARVAAPTIVMHRENDRSVPASMGREVAAGIPGAQFVLLQGRTNMPEYGDAEAVLATMRSFLADAPAAAAVVASVPASSNEGPVRWRDRYEPLGVAGVGGQGSVLRARDHQHGRLVALKVRDAGPTVDRSELLAEARVLLGLRPHAALPLVRDDFFQDDRYVIVMDWVHGTDLRTLLDRQGDPGLPVTTVLSYLSDVAAALDHLHAHDPPVVHGDVKPANMIVTPEGRVVLVDFGVATAGGGAPAGSGTRGYVAPEVAAGGSVTPAADVFGLAATAFALLTARSPGHEWSDWEGFAPAHARALGRAIRLGMSADPERRPRRASEFLERLRSWQESSLPAGTITLLLTDVEGSTALWDAHPDTMPAALARHEDLVADAVEAHGGRFIKSRGEGDSTLSVFVRASDALAAALAMQRTLAGEVWPRGVDVRVRVGLHTGEAELREGDYYGTTVNRAARIRGLAAGGEILLSHATTQLVADTLPPGAALADHGTHELRGLARSEQIFRVEVSDLPPSGRSDTLRADVTLPQPRTSFVGREREAADVLGLLTKARLVTLAGSGGVGKTRLSLEVAGAAALRSGGSVFFADLSTITDPQRVLVTVAAAVNAKGEGDDMAAILALYLKDREALVVLDNCEHVIDAAADVADLLLASCPRVRVLATSREPLQLDGEQTYRVAPLEADDESSPAVRLFADRATSVLSGFTLDGGNRGDVLAICRRLDGIPLAIELAAARVGSLSVADIAAGLDDRFELLASGLRGRPDRQRTLHAAIDWSWDLLSGQEQQALRRLAVFAGPFALDAAQGICGAQPHTVASLVSKSLVTREAGRYRLLETVRMYGIERLEQAGELDATRDAHRDWFVSYAESFDLDDLLGAIGLNRLADDYADIRAAMGWCTTQGRRDLEARLLVASVAALVYIPARMNELEVGLQSYGADDTLEIGLRADALTMLAFVAMMRATSFAGSPARQALALEAGDHRFLPIALWLGGRTDDAADAARRRGQHAFARLCRTWAASRTMFDPAGALRELEEISGGLDPELVAWDHIFTHIALVVARLLSGDAEGALRSVSDVRVSFSPYEERHLSSSKRYPDVIEALVLARSGRTVEARAVLAPTAEAMLADRWPLMAEECLTAAACIVAAEGDVPRAARLLEPVVRSLRFRYLPNINLLLWLAGDMNRTLERAGASSPLPTVDEMLALAGELSHGRFPPARTDEVDALLRAYLAERPQRPTDRGTRPPRNASLGNAPE